ncbi:replication initiation factor domain-containing protein [Lactobacillus johnsonii]|uniref:replication initiation factor domain-containing protein n=1 Tax=Lactobacillus johnsonii TaxID=33959 RepID=UPI00202A9982|nr:replication initiation factor domain-containing protein [Lactobacillus johnsonii]
MKGHFTSRWSKWDEVTSRQTSTNAFLGRTMYFGSQASDLFCRVYDKTLERKINSDQKDIPEKWTRLEMVYRKDRAKKLVDHMINGHKSPGYVLRGSLKQYLRLFCR